MIEIEPIKVRLWECETSRNFTGESKIHHCCARENICPHFGKITPRSKRDKSLFLSNKGMKYEHE